MTLRELDHLLAGLEAVLRTAEDCLQRCRDGLEGSAPGDENVYADRQASLAQGYVEQARQTVTAAANEIVKQSVIKLPAHPLEGLVSTDVRYPYVAALLKQLRGGK